MNNNSFDKCYYSLDNSIEYLDKINDYVEKNNGELGKYENSIFCPECRQAELTYVHRTTKKRAFLRSKFSKPHSDSCSYRHKYNRSQNFSKEYYESLTDEQIQDKLEATMREFSHKNSTIRILGVCENNFEENNNPSVQEKEENSRGKKLVRHKKLDERLDREIEGLLHIFYGKVQLKIRKYSKTNEKGEHYTFHYMDVLCQNKGKVFTKRTEIYRGGIEDNIDENKLYKFVAIGKLDFPDNYPPRLNLLNNKSILFRLIE